MTDPLQKIVERTRLHKAKEADYIAQKAELSNQLSILLGQRAAWQLSQSSLEKRIETLKQKIANAKRGDNPLPPPPVPSTIPTPQVVTPVSTPVKNTEEKTPPPVRPIEFHAPPTPPAIPEKAASSSSGKHTRGKKKRGGSSGSPATLKCVISIHLDAVRALCFYNSLPVIASASDDGTIRLTNIEPYSAAGKKLKNPVNFCSLRGHAAPVVCLTQYEDNGHQYLISGSVDGTIAVWDAPDPKSASIYEVQGNVTHHRLHAYSFHDDAVWSIATDGKQCASASADGRVLLWHPNENPEQVQVQTKNTPIAVKFFAPGKFFVASADGTFELFEGTEKSGEFSIPFRIRMVADVLDGDSVPVTGFDGHLLVVSLSQGKVTRDICASNKQLTAAGMTSDGEVVVTAAADRETRVWLVDGPEDKLIYAEVTHRLKYGESTLAFAATTASAKKQYFATGGAEGSIYVYAHGG